jgi:hypothetical protein
LTAPRPIKSTSPRCHSAWQPNPGRGSTYRRRKSVQTTGATSFKLTTLAGFILIPFGLFNKTSFLAERVLGNVVASGVKVLALAVIIGIGTTLFGELAVVREIRARAKAVASRTAETPYM